jgi:putative membrane protein
LNRVARALLALTVVAAIAAGLLAHARPDAVWPVGVLLVVATASTLVSLTRTLQVQNVCVTAAFILVLAAAVLFLDAKTAIPFGPLIFTPNCGEQIFDALPLTPPLLWLVIILNCRGVARLILRPWRKLRTYGFRVIGLTCLLTVLFDLGLEPFATRVHRFWIWDVTGTAPGWFAAPWVNFLGWAMTTLLILAFTTPWLINKMPSGKRPPDIHPLFLWLTLNLYLAASLATHQLWPATATVLGVSMVTSVLAWRNK